MKTSLEIPDSRIADLLCSAWEGGSNYWARSDGTPYDWDRTSPPPSDMVLRLPVTVTDIEDDARKVYTLDRAAIARGLALFPVKAPQAFGDFLSEDDDASTGDIFLQLCLFGELVYG